MADTSLDQEARIQLALAAYEAKEVSSIRQAATTFNVPRATLQDRIHGRKPNKTSKTHLQRLTPKEEESVVRAIYQLDAWGWPMTIKAMKELACQQLTSKGDHLPLGKCWYSNFLARNLI